MVAAIRWQLAIPLVALMLIGFPGCDSSADTGPGSYQAVKQAADNAEDLLESRGATLKRKSYPLGDAWVVDLSGQQLDNELLEALRNLDRIAELNLSNTHLTDSQLEQIAQSKIGGVLTVVDLSQTEISDAGLKHLTSGFLTKLNLSGTNVTDAGVREWEQQRASNEKIRDQFKKVQIER